VVGDSNVNIPSDSDLDNLDPGERAAIVLAVATGANLVVSMICWDDRLLCLVSERVTGLLVLDEAAKQNLVNFPGDCSSATNHISSLVKADSVALAAASIRKQTVIVTSSNLWTVF